MSKLHICIFTSDEYDLVLRGLNLLKETFEVRARDAESGPLSPDDENRDDANRGLEIAKSAIEVCNNAAPYFKAD